MVKLNFLGKLKPKKKGTILEEKTIKNEKKNGIIETKPEKLSEKPAAEYKETLYSSEFNGSKKTNEHAYQPAPDLFTEQRRFRDVESIEDNIDNLPIYLVKGVTANTEMDKKVDHAISKTVTKRKPANVIYVVSKPQPGQVKGDWAVRSHGKIFSHHRTKENAIKAARMIARARNATVLVQNTDGNFSDGFKPRPKS